MGWDAAHERRRLEVLPPGQRDIDVKGVILQTGGEAKGAQQPLGHVASAHIELALGADSETVRLAVAATLLERYDIERVTLQVEPEGCVDAPHLHP